MRVKVNYYIDEFIKGKWHTIDMSTEEDADIHENFLRYLLERPKAKLRIRKVEIPCTTIQL